MMAAILLRGLGLGFLFLSITLIAFGNLNSRNRASGIALFNTGRQLGGLMGVAGLQTLIDHNVTTNVAALGAHVTAGAPVVSERLTTTAALLAARGMDAVAAGRIATSLLGKVVTGQSTVIAFDTAFNAVALLFVFAAPLLVAIKIGLSRYASFRRRLQRRVTRHDDLDFRAHAGFGFQMDPATQTIGHDVVDDVQPQTGVALVAPCGEKRIEHLALDLRAHAAAVV